MQSIFKISSDSVIDFAAEELRKYLRMLMPYGGDVSIEYCADAKTGLRIGLMSDFGLDTSDAESNLDDIVYIKTNGGDGVVAGSNPCATLIAVYRYLRFCGCRWIFPGLDGEWIPEIEKLPCVDYRKKADHRYRGQCIEGAESQQTMMEAIDFAPKIGMNTFKIQFNNPFCFYNEYYAHSLNHARAEELVSRETTMRWKRQCEVEIKKRGLAFHDMGHGWTAEPFGLDSSAGWRASDDFTVPEETNELLAMLNGKRELRLNTPLLTNVCMSNPKTRDIMAKYIADYAELHSNVDFLHIGLADMSNGHCECDECRKKNTSDWYVMLLNDIDKELTKRNLNTRLVFVAYLDTFWAPLYEKLDNQDRFLMFYAPITRKYTETYAVDANKDKIVDYIRNNIQKPRGMDECLAYLYDWKDKMWKGDCMSAEYHFMDFQYWDLSGIFITKILYDDICSLEKHGIKGILTYGSQRSFYPTGFLFYVLGETLFDKSISYKDLRKDYFSHAFGEKWEKVIEYLEKIKELMRYSYFHGFESKDTEKGDLYNPDMQENARKANEIIKAFAPVIKENLYQNQRASSVAWQILDLHNYSVDMMTKMIEKLCVGNNKEASKILKEMTKTMAGREVYYEKYYDHYLFTLVNTRYSDEGEELFNNMNV